MIDWLASYPKSGNTWLRMLLANYGRETHDAHDINAPAATRGIAGSRWLFDTYLGLPSNELREAEIRALRPMLYRTIAQRLPERTWMKVHDRQGRAAGEEWLIPPDAAGVVIYIIRHPLDVAVSNAFHDGHGDMARAVAKLCRRGAALGGGGTDQLRQVTGDWSEHVSSWVDEPAIPVLVVRYEDMLDDAAAVLGRVLRFAGRVDGGIDPERLRAAAWHARFGALQAAEALNGFGEAPRRGTPFFRRGRAGDWRDHLAPQQVRTIVERHGAMMQRFGYSVEP